MAQREEIIRRTVYVSDIDQQVNVIERPQASVIFFPSAEELSNNSKFFLAKMRREFQLILCH